MKQPIKVTFMVPWGMYCKGDVITPPGMLRCWLIEQGYCRVVRDPALVETAMNDTPERAAGVIKKRRRRVRGL